MTKNEALKLLSCNITSLADLLEISTQAISQWPEQEIPLVREYQIRDLASGKKPIKKSSSFTLMD